MSQQHRLIRIGDVMRRTGHARSTVYAMVSAGKFPKPIKLGDGVRASAWIESEIDQHIANLIAASRGGPSQGARGDGKRS
jgi:prophage regulatory protein